VPSVLTVDTLQSYHPHAWMRPPVHVKAGLYGVVNGYPNDWTPQWPASLLDAVNCIDRQSGESRTAAFSISGHSRTSAGMPWSGRLPLEANAGSWD